MNKTARATLLFSVILHTTFILSSTGCGPRRTPNLDRIFASARAREGKRPIIIIPGILGSQMINRHTGEVVWPSAFRSSADGLNLPATPDLAANLDDLVASRIVVTAKLARLAPEVYVYYEMLRALERFGGYREGQWETPPENGDRDTFYIFPYDWRRDNVETAREFVARVEELKRKLNRPDLRFNVVAHSMGGLLARYAAMYGARDLPPDGVAPQPDWDGARFINKIFMFGTPNEGSAEAFASLLTGYSVTEGLRRRVSLLNKLSREDALTIPSIYQLLPHRGQVRFLDENLQPLRVDLYDPDTWRRYGWGAVSDAGFRDGYARGKIKGQESPTHKGTLDELDAYFAAALNRARRFHEAIDASDAGRTSPVPLFAFGGDCEETLAAPILFQDRKRGRWETLIAPRAIRNAAGRRFSRKEVTEAMFAPGDGRVTRASLLGENLGTNRRSALYDTPLPIAYAVFACDLHGEVQNNKTLLDNALTLFLGEMMN